MGKLKRFALFSLSVILLMAGSACRLTPIKARTIEELLGTYSLIEYNITVEEQVTDLIDSLDFFYLVVNENACVMTAYRSVGSDDCVTGEYNTMYQYKSGTTDMIEEVKARIPMPHSTLENGLELNYFTVSPDDTLVCQKFIYEKPESSDQPTIRKIIYLKLVKVSNISTYSYIEEVTGIAPIKTRHF